MHDQDARHTQSYRVPGPRALSSGGMLTEETHSAGVADKIASHEEAAHEKRNWVRLTFDCNDHCVFCLDSDAHDGTMRDREDVKRQILDGRRKAGATRLILSGGEPTIHPHYVDFVRLGRLAGYPKIQTVTNGRMFAYGDFLERCLDAGLSEITFSLHGPNAKVHDALVGTKGAFEEEMTGLKARARPTARPIVNVDIVVNRANVKHAARDAAMLVDLGVNEFDLLQVVPFGRAFTRRARHALLRSGRDAALHPGGARLLEEARRPHLDEPLPAAAPRGLRAPHPGPVQAERRGPRSQGGVRALLDDGEPLDCREPARCKYCYLEKLCDSLEKTMERADTRAFEIVRVDSEAEDHAPVTFGGDPATARKRLPMAGQSNRPARPPATELVRTSGARTLAIVAPDAPSARAIADRFPDLPHLELRLSDWSGLDDLLRDRDVTRVEARTSAAARELLAKDARFEVVVDLTLETAAWLSSLERVPERLALRQPTYERLTEASEHDADLRSLFAHPALAQVPVEGVAACILGRPPRERPAMLDLSTFAGPVEEGRLEIFRWTRRYLVAGYMTRSLRCVQCSFSASCPGMHVNFVRAHGYASMQPVLPRDNR